MKPSQCQSWLDLAGVLLEQEGDENAIRSSKYLVFLAKGEVILDLQPLHWHEDLPQVVPEARLGAPALCRQLLPVMTFKATLKR
jgi:hypothetical protein